MATIHKIVPIGLDKPQIEYIYNSFVKNQGKSYEYVTENVLNVAVPIFENEGGNQDRLNDLLLQVASAANIFKLLTEELASCQTE